MLVSLVHLGVQLLRTVAFEEPCFAAGNVKRLQLQEGKVKGGQIHRRTLFNQTY